MDNENNVVICHERLSIVGVDMVHNLLDNDEFILSVNGEIYNHQDYIKQCYITNIYLIQKVIAK